MYNTFMKPSKNAFLLFLLLLLINVQQLKSQYQLGARQAAMSNCGVTLSDIWSVSHNQAGLASLTSISIAGHYENLYMIEKLNLGAFAMAYPTTKSGTFALSMIHYGYSEYSNFNAGLGYAKQLGKRFAAGLQLNMFVVSLQQQYGNHFTVVGEAGLLAEPVDNLFLGAHFYNVSNSKIDYYQVYLPVIIQVGLGYNLQDVLYLSAEIEKPDGYDTEYNFGAELNLFENLAVRGGASTSLESYSFGLGYIHKSFTFDIGFVNHPYLNYTTNISMGYNFVQ